MNPASSGTETLSRLCWQTAIYPNRQNVLNQIRFSLSWVLSNFSELCLSHSNQDSKNHPEMEGPTITEESDSLALSAPHIGEASWGLTALQARAGQSWVWSVKLTLDLKALKSTSCSFSLYEYAPYGESMAVQYAKSYKTYPAEKWMEPHAGLGTRLCAGHMLDAPR